MADWIDDLVQRLPHVRERTQFIQEVRDMDREELQRRLLISADWAGYSTKILDGIPEIACIPGGGSDGTRLPDNVRAVVKRLVKASPLTWEKSWEGRKRPALWHCVACRLEWPTDGRCDVCDQPGAAGPLPAWT